MVSACGSGSGISSSVADRDPAHARTATTPTSGEVYNSERFVVPLTLVVDDALNSPPNPDAKQLLSWDADPSPDGNRVRFFVPVELYPPGSRTPEAPPEDYLAYLQGPVAERAQISNVIRTTIGGRPATLMTITNDGRPENDLHGALGCPERNADPGEGCFGIQPDRILRLAVIDIDGTTLLTWARVNKIGGDNSFVEMFERMLRTVQFR